MVSIWTMEVMEHVMCNTSHRETTHGDLGCDRCRDERVNEANSISDR